MSTLVHDFHFLQPLWLLALLALPLLAWFGLRADPARVVFARLVDPALLPHLLHGRASDRRLPHGLLALAWTLAALAMAGPAWRRVPQPLYAERAAQVVAVSMSSHMLARDVAPSRLDRALYKTRQLLDANAGGLNGLAAYAGDAFTVAPLTADVHSLDQLLGALSPDTMPVDGDNAAAAIDNAAKLILGAKVHGGSIVLVTDEADASADAAARRARAEGITVSVLGVGTPAGAPVPQSDGSFLRDTGGALVMARRDDAALVALAAAGGGRYVPMSGDDADIAALRGELKADGTPQAVHADGAAAWQDEGPWLLIPLLLLGALGFRRGWLLALPLLVLPAITAPAHAGDIHWWLRPDQQAARDLRAGDAATAQSVAKSPGWRGAAAYRQHDYAAAAQALAASTDRNAPYDLGNALARQGDYQKAIDAYDRALKLDPDDADAKYNRALVEQAMRKQQQAQSQQNNQGGQNKNGQNLSGQNQAGQNQSGKGQSGRGQNDQGQNGQDQNGKGQNDQSQGDQDQSGQNQNGQNQNGKGKKGKDQSGQNQGGKDQNSQNGQNGQNQNGQNQNAQGQNAQSQNAQGQAPNQPSSTHQNAGQQQRGDNAPTPQNAQQQAAAQARADAARQALKQQMDRQLGGEASTPSRQQNGPRPHDLGAVAADDPMSKLPADARRILDRVQDDPGGLLRRKFELEYRERHGDDPSAQQQEQ